MSDDCTSGSPDQLRILRDKLRQFAEERDWNQFHSPKNLAMALSIEAAELMEHFQWISEAESQSLPIEKREKIREEVADVLLYLIRLADKLEIDLSAAAVEKIEVNTSKYPIQKARGNSKKYTDL
jgi:NTP pyrophosphatase (non-canonical NTP hydrolase)